MEDRERQRQNGSWARERDGPEEVRMVRDRLTGTTYLQPVSKVMSGPRLLLRVKSWSKVLKQLRGLC